MTGDHDWYQAETWSEENAWLFEKRISRARGMRPQYLEIQGRTLLRAATRDDREAGRALLRRLISEYEGAPDSYLDARHAVVASWGLLGESCRADGEFAEALTAFAALRTLAPTVPHLHTASLEIRYLDVLLDLGDKDALDEAFIEVERLRVKLAADSFQFPRDTFALAVRAARLYRRIGHSRALVEASTALAIVTDMEDPIRRHRVLGRIDATVDELNELDAIVEAFRP